LTIHRYFFPSGGDKRVPYTKIRGVEERALGPVTGQWRIWGMGFPPYFFHLDGDRPKKTRAIALDVGGVIRPTITPDDVDAVLKVLREKAPSS
jgi:hypothetical protein